MSFFADANGSKLPYEVALVADKSTLWSYRNKATGAVHAVSPPKVEINKVPVVCAVSKWSPPSVSAASTTISEVHTHGQVDGHPGLVLQAVFRVAAASPIIRFSYVLRAEKSSQYQLTRSNGSDALEYLTVPWSAPEATVEVRLSEYLEPAHTYTISERQISPEAFSDGLRTMGPILVNSSKGESALVAYEHGSQVPDAFVGFHFDTAADQPSVTVEAIKGNYLNNQDLYSKPLNTIWFEFGAVKGSSDDLAAAYREFVLNHMATHNESRKPYIFYNTWNRQERDFYWKGLDYFAAMNEEAVLKDIDAAHAMGIDVYVLDVCWFAKSGDWVYSPERFPNGLGAVKQRLEKYGMKMGIWFEPKSAAISTKLLKDNKQCIMSWKGKQYTPEIIWKTEESHQMCLVSKWADQFADKMIERAKEYGVTYFKWDAISQYGCDSPDHDHGDSSHSRQERADSYAFNLGRAMMYIVDKVNRAVEGAIVDFDVTEGSRFVGLGFLTVGKFFLVNNGPSHSIHDMPYPPGYAKEPKGPANTNIAFYPGPARAWTCRAPLGYDKWIPSILFLVHYYPDDKYPEIYQKHAQLERYGAGGEEDVGPVDIGADNQKLNIGSLILGSNGIWGDLLDVSPEGVKRIRKYLDQYKRVKDSVTSAGIIREGMIGGNPEIYEKVASNGKGVVVIFASSFGKPYSAKIVGRYTYITKNKVDPSIWHDGEGVDVHVTPSGRARVDVTFNNASARIIMFG